MNPKFFDVKKEKQDAIINAALMIFAENGYKKSSTDIIVKEAGISKGLLFHYFVSKQGLYEFVFDYSVKYMMLELTQSVKKNETDFFEIQRQIELAKTRVMKNYPYMQQFLSNIKFENSPEALETIGESLGVLAETYDNIYRQADLSKFYSMIDVSKVVSIIGWMSDGFIKDKFSEGNPDLDEMNAEFAQYLSMLRDAFYKGTGQGLSSVIDELESGNDSVVMDSIRDAMGKKAISEMTFEERLAAGKKPLVEIPEEEAVEETDTQEVKNAETDTEAEIKDIAKEALAESINSIIEKDLNKETDLSADSVVSDGENERASGVAETVAFESEDEYKASTDSLNSTAEENTEVIANSTEAENVSYAAENVMENTEVHKEETEATEDKTDSQMSERDRELKEMGPAPKLPQINPELLNKKEATVDDEKVEEAPSYYPLRF